MIGWSVPTMSMVLETQIVTTVTCYRIRQEMVCFRGHRLPGLALIGVVHAPLEWEASLI